jgi:hypothetical protein
MVIILHNNVVKHIIGADNMARKAQIGPEINFIFLQVWSFAKKRQRRNRISQVHLYY